MGQREQYREKARGEVSAWIDPEREGDLCDKFWYVDCIRQDNTNAWHIILGEEKIFYSATRLCETEIVPDNPEELQEADPVSFDELALWCEVVLDEVKRAIQRYLESVGPYHIRDWGVSIGEETYRLLNGPRLDGWRQDPRRFITEYTLIEARMRESTEVWSDD